MIALNTPICFFISRLRRFLVPFNRSRMHFSHYFYKHLHQINENQKYFYKIREINIKIDRNYRRWLRKQINWSKLLTLFAKKDKIYWKSSYFLEDINHCFVYGTKITKQKLCWTKVDMLSFYLKNDKYFDFATKNDKHFECI